MSDGKLRIIDIGDGLAADINGFEDTPLAATILKNLHKKTEAIVVPIFGELPYDAMHTKTMHIPLLMRQAATVNDVADLSVREDHLLPYSQYNRVQSAVSHAWNKNYQMWLLALLH